jgi:iron complex outermembrane receptor protein
MVVARSRGAVVLWTALWCATSLAADQPEAKTSDARTEQTHVEKPQEPRVEEIGGRLVVTGETVQVTAEVDAPVTRSSLATKTDTPLLETPRSVSIVDRQTLDDMKVTDIAQAHDYTAGFTPADERGPAFDRGFPLGFYDLRRDGLRTYTWSVREPAGLDRIQYLRGPAGLLYGDGSPGGIVNLVLKKPLPVPRYQASLGAGELGFRRVTGDATGPISSGGAARYRLVGAFEEGDGGFDNDESRLSVLPMLAFDFGRSVTLELDGEYYDQRGRGYAHYVPPTPAAQHGDFSAIPWDLNVASPGDAWRGWNASGGYQLDIRLSPAAQLHAAGRYTRIDGDIDAHGLAGFDAAALAIRRFHYHEISRWDEYQTDTFGAFTFGTGSARHRLVTGVEAGLSTAESRIGVSAAAPLSLGAPVYAPPDGEPILSPSGSHLLRLGVYAQDQVRLGGRWTFVPGVRLSSFRLDDRSPAAASTGATRATDVHVDPALGAVFLPRPWLSLYASWTEGFQPPPAGQHLEDGRALAPIDSRSLEGGLKAEALGGRLILAAGLFAIRQTNVAEADPQGFYRQIAEGSSHGLEVEASGSPVHGLVVLGGYAWLHTEITRDASGFVGNALPNAPAHKANLWTRYRLPRGPLRHLGAGLGVVYVSSRFTTGANTVTMPSYTRLDGGLSYEGVDRRVGFALTAENLTDTRYVTSGLGQAFIAGPARRIFITVSTAF